MDKAASRIRLHATEAFLFKNMMTSTYNIIKSTLQISRIDF